MKWLKRRVLLLVLPVLLFEGGLSLSCFASQEQKVFLTIKKIVVEGNTLVPSSEIEKITDKYIGKPLTLKTLDEIASSITDLLLRKGFITSRAYIPPQKVKNGVVVIKIAEGRVGNIYIEGGISEKKKLFVLSFFEDLKGKVLNKRQIERKLLVLNDNPGLKVTADLKKGKEPLTTDVYLKVKKQRDVKGKVFLNNWGSKYTSRIRYGLGLDIGNVFLEGSRLSFSGIVGSSYHRLHSGSVSYEIPAGRNGLRTGFWGSFGNSNLGRELAVLNIKSYSRAFGFYFNYPFVKLVNKELDFQFSFNSVYSKQTMLGATTSEDHVRYVQGTVLYRKNEVFSQNLMEFSVTQGLGATFGSGDNEAEASRYNASTKFTKFNLGLTRVQRLTESVFGVLKFKGQYSKSILMSSQDFYIGGPASIRGFLLTQYGGDSGYSLSGELRWAPTPDRQSLQFLCFFDTGKVFLNHPYSGQEKKRALTGAGFGMRLNLPGDFRIKADVGYPIHPKLDGGVRHLNTYVQITKEF
ncbi:Hemolysin activation/secretion protein [Desulfurobacterium pacificum]|uniref:Hemolysin activation/secretion protein n=1 Tax=Desulfurobacterium pacificum TaxID=240166 RepID=A0ABY1NES1_9BACT|nr:ShlB/FhaC/HecB family hemolysin secretion/activation protein [Desulfurobacterium pacificum]SMP07417.1 Hemolysin activation/secretion protein [Desulfurobacterium pacificum]